MLLWIQYGRGAFFISKYTDASGQAKTINVVTNTPVKLNGSDVSSLEDIEIGEGSKISYDIKIEGEDDFDEGDGEAVLFKEDGKWKVCAMSIDEYLADLRTDFPAQA